MVNDERINKLEKRVERMEILQQEMSKTQTKDWYELKAMIVEAVNDGNDKVLEKIENLEKRIITLENQDGEKAKAVLKSILITSLSWFVLGLLNNLPLFINK